MDLPTDDDKERKESTNVVEEEAEEIQEDLPSTSTSDEEQVDPIPKPVVTTPSISMSAGADPWADPSPAAVLASTVPPSKRTADNPWATNTPDIGTEIDTFQQEAVSKMALKGQTGEEGRSEDALHQDQRWGEYHLPKLGNAVARYWDFKAGYLQLNSGERAGDMRSEVRRSKMELIHFSFVKK